MFYSHNFRVIEYIIKRVDERIKNMQNSRLLFINTISLDELKKNKSTFIKLFLEIEDDLKQSSQGLSSLLTQNKDVLEEKENYDKVIRRYELKSLNLEKTLYELTSKYKELLNENFSSIQKIKDIDNFSSKINSLENSLELKNKSIFQLEIENKQLIQKYDKINSELKQTFETLSKHNENTFKTSPKIVDDNDHKPSQTNDEYIDKSMINNKNISNYIKDRQLKKKLINQVIKEHLYNDNEEGENEDLYHESIITSYFR